MSPLLKDYQILHNFPLFKYSKKSKENYPPPQKKTTNKQNQQTHDIQNENKLQNSELNGSTWSKCWIAKYANVRLKYSNTSNNEVTNNILHTEMSKYYTVRHKW